MENNDVCSNSCSAAESTLHHGSECRSAVALSMATKALAMGNSFAGGCQASDQRKKNRKAKRGLSKMTEEGPILDPSEMGTSKEKIHQRIGEV